MSYFFLKYALLFICNHLKVSLSITVYPLKTNRLWISAAPFHTHIKKGTHSYFELFIISF